MCYQYICFAVFKLCFCEINNSRIIKREKLKLLVCVLPKLCSSCSEDKVSIGSTIANQKKLETIAKKYHLKKSDIDVEFRGINFAFKTLIYC